MARPLVLDANRFLGGDARPSTPGSTTSAWERPPHDARPLDGRAALVTGASQGLGLAIARAYVEAGASVMICARDADAARAARAAEVAALAAPGAARARAARPTCRSADDVERAGRRGARRRFRELHILVNNAGVYGPMGPIEDVDWDDWVRAIEINLLGSVLLCRALLPHFKRAALRQDRPAVRRRRDQSAAAHQRLRRVEGGDRPLRRDAGARGAATIGIDVNAIAPGALNTRMLDEVLAAGPAAVGAGVLRAHEADRRRGRHAARDGRRAGRVPRRRRRATASPAGCSARSGIPGTTCPSIATSSTRTDIYTLRRIVPADRGLDWGDQ